MTIDGLVLHLDGVRRSGRGWVARCPAHDDRSPSLSIREGERGILLKCWAGCTLAEICAALGIVPRQLFFDDNGPVDRRAIRRHQARRQAAHARQRAKGKRTDALREAESVIRAATSVDISGWSGEQLDVALTLVCDARAVLEREDTNATEPESATA